jgi:hypothetical protein
MATLIWRAKFKHQEFKTENNENLVCKKKISVNATFKIFEKKTLKFETFFKENVKIQEF